MLSARVPRLSGLIRAPRRESASIYSSLFVIFAQAAQPRQALCARVSRLPVNEVPRQSAAQRPADDTAAERGEGESHPLHTLQTGRQRLDGNRADDRHQGTEHRAKEPAVARVYRRIALLARVRRIQQRSLIGTFDDLCCVLGVLTARRATEYERMPFPNLHGDSPVFRDC